MTTEKDEYSIFRAEALRYKRESWLGSARLHIPSGLTLCLYTGLLTFSFIVLIITFTSYSERVNVSGVVVYAPPAVSLIAQNDGIITRSLASEGGKIKTNELIFAISGDTHTNLGLANFKIKELLTKQRDALLRKINTSSEEYQQKTNHFKKMISNKTQELNSLKSLIENMEKQKKWFEDKSNSYTNFRKKGITLDSEMIERKKDYYSAIINLSSAKVNYFTLLGNLLDLENKASSMDRELAEKIESFNIEVAGIDQKILDAEKNKEYLIVAPFDGVITNVTSHIGERVISGQKIGILIPEHSITKIELHSTSDFLGEVASGQKVKIRVAAYPYHWYGKIAGVIETISKAPIKMTSPTLAEPNNSEKGLFRIIVIPELTEQQGEMSLLPGMEVQTEIYVKTRRVYEWLFMPFKQAYKRAIDSVE